MDDFVKFAEYILELLSLPFYITENYLLITALIPLLSAVIILCAGRWTQGITIMSSVVLFVYVCLCSSYCLLKEDSTHFVVMDFGKNLHLSLNLEPIGAVFSLLIAFLWILTSIYTTHYMKGHASYSSFLCLFSISISCTIFIAFSGDLFTTFVFYELLTLSTYPLVVYNLTEESRAAGRYYFGILFFASLVLFLPVVGLLYNKFHTVDFVSYGIFIPDHSLVNFVAVCFPMMIYGIAKTALMPMHFWLPKAMVAPTPVSALLHAVAVVKSGVFIVIKIILYIFGIENLKYFVQQNWLAGQWLPYAAGCTIIASSFIALKQKELKTLLAYSTISQLSYIILFVSILSISSIKVTVMQLIYHALAKITLFFVAGIIIFKTGERYIDRIHGIGRSMPMAMIAFTIGALSMIGVPPAPTFWNKLLIFKIVFAGNDIVLSIFIVLVLTASTVLNALYFLPIIYNAFFAKSSQNFFIKKPSIYLVLPPVVTAICTLILFFVASLYFN
ncbi:cation:proton antiporter [Wolbachia pipientis]|uniref:Cation:proton antiporter n=1 Tax=Wolbachia pipientis TaxID=955 RepID=A0A1E7QKT9_WOLPI|nr:proton-conducting transporter membrane subunit [Wolbachia pipientis]OEY86824.1 cation:proton antiporter [Wolbachia pipientis]